MRYASFRSSSGPGWGIASERGIVDVGSRVPGVPTLQAALANGVLSGIQIGDHEVDFDFDEIIWDPVITNPGRIICVGLNYREHLAETKRDPTAQPTMFTRFASSQVGHLQPMQLPPESECLDYEGELAVVIGARCRRVPTHEALSVVAGYACYNDASIRDFQRHSSQFTAGKNWPGTGAFGPWLVSADEIADISALRLETRLNGAVVQSAGLGQLIFDVSSLIAYCSTWTELWPGDVIVTGTPGGVGAARKPPLWMRSGDVIEVEISSIGTLSNRIERER